MEIIRSLLKAAMVLLLGVSLAHAATNGAYVLEGGSYVVDVTFKGNTVTVKEPNRSTIYTQQGRINEYRYTNPKNGVTYGIRVKDDTTLEAFKDQSRNVASILKLRKSLTPGDNPSEEVVNAAKAVANRYMVLSESDPTNAQSWTQCAAAAMARSILTAQQADESERQAATLLKMISVDKSHSPCPDAISEVAWRSAKP